jgi:hypothetical protein
MNGSRRIYDEAVKEVLIVLWEAADRICGERHIHCGHAKAPGTFFTTYDK